jgi:acyl-CoA synthetase (AMP-forming)/AMP-acid ligase II
VIDEVRRARSDELELDQAPDSVAFVLHTSGTTGRPRPVPYRQDALAQRVRVVSSIIGLGPGTRYATMSPLHHVAGLGNHAVAIGAGACTVPVPRFSLDEWRGLAPLGVTHVLCVPTVLDLLLAEGLLAFDSLRAVQYGASPIHPETLRSALAVLPDVELANLFGQTEGSPLTCLTPTDHRRIVADGRDDLLASVGRAVEGVELRIADPDHRGVGEVLARGAHLMRLDDDGWLHTSDLGRTDDDGFLFLAGRRADMIIRGGENVHPLEVEQALELHVTVREAAVVGVPDRRLGQEVTAFIVPADSVAGVDPAALRSHTRRLLAGFKVPSRWVVVHELPRNASGKLLRRQLTAL